METTQEIRQRMISHRKSLLRGEVSARSAQLIQRLIHLPIYRQAESVLVYYPINGEVDLMDLLLQSDEKSFYLPRMKGNGLEMVRYDEGDPLDIGRFGVSEPKGDVKPSEKRVDLVLVPGVAFDRLGVRIGHGKGFYDRFLSQIDTHIVGVCFDFQLFEQLPPKQPHDVMMHYVVTEQEVVRCNELKLISDPD